MSGFRLDLRQIKVTPVFERNLEAQSRTVVNIGGARSSKSHSIAQLLIMKLCNEPGKNIAVTRKTMPALRMTAYRLFINLLKEYGGYFPQFHNKTEHYYELNGSRVQFFSLDEPDKIKSTEFNYVWMEEANEFSYDDYMTLLTRLSGRTPKGERNRMFLSLNPSDAAGWIPKILLAQQDVEVIKSTYKDNPFIGGEYAQILEALKTQDENYYRIYALGQWGCAQNLVYTRYDFCDALPDNPDEIFWGLDFGFNNPTALVKAAVKDGVLYLRQMLYRSGLTNSGLIEALQAIIPETERHQCLYADSAEPARIEEIKAAGFNIYPAEKSVSCGIDAVKRFRLCIAKDSADLIKEILAYKWKTDKDGTILDSPVKFNDHALDALRYAVCTRLRSAGNMPDIAILG